MSNKPTYAAIVNSDTPTKSSNSNSGIGSSGAGPSDAPPPYTAPSHNAQIPHQTILPPSDQQQQQQQLQRSYQNDVESSHHNQNGWTPPPSYAVARSRALKRFWLAFFWAWLIWIFIGLLIGGGVSDISNDNSRGHHGHWDKHGEWHDDNGGVYSGAISMVVKVKDKAIGVLPDFV
ncbi:uncharacterized protein L201_005913 [Kwoniella dendrophila CBS 6074]|uniref:Uncharacterized protein n=1 Tax=Kwoniella dendrophila CBS 6074 TaxID=1295534 RepID=A0AAX4K0R1_9TREE